MGFRRTLRISLFTSLLMGLHSLNTWADGIAYQFSGFASLGLVSNDNSNLRFRRDVSQQVGSTDGDIEWRTDSLLGLQAHARWSDQFDTTAQVVIKDRLDNTLMNSLEWGFLGYHPIDGLDVRVGRMGSDIFMLSEYSQVDYAFQWVRPPHEFYGLLALHHFDGIDLNKRVDLGASTLNIKTFYGNSDDEYPTGANGKQKFKVDFNVGGVSTVLDWENWKFRYTFAKVDIKNNGAAALGDALNSVSPYWPDAAVLARDFYTQGKNFKYNEFGVSYDNNVWWGQAEATKLDSNAVVIPSTKHFYISIGRRFGEFSVYGIRGYVHALSDTYTISSPPNYPSPLAEQLAGLAYATEYSLNGGRANESSFGVGVRWDFTTKMALKFQAEKFKIEKNGANIWLKTKEGYLPEDQTANVLSLTMDVLF